LLLRTRQVCDLILQIYAFLRMGLRSPTQYGRIRLRLKQKSGSRFRAALRNLRCITEKRMLATPATRIAPSSSATGLPATLPTIGSTSTGGNPIQALYLTLTTNWRFDHPAIRHRAPCEVWYPRPRSRKELLSNT